jgi:hypothetical protein
VTSASSLQKEVTMQLARASNTAVPAMAVDVDDVITLKT